MPKTVRNFWLNLDVDGRASSTGTGPAGHTGGFVLTVLLREDGGISERRLRVRGYSNGSTVYLEAYAEGEGTEALPVLRLQAAR
jgi:hypothetical protein